MRIASISVLALLIGCGDGPEPLFVASSQRALVGVPVDGYPTYDERLQLVAQNRARSDPNNVAAGTAADCSTPLAAQPPLDYNLDAAQAARFHSRYLQVNDLPLSHYSYCALRADIEATGCDGTAACACETGAIECAPSPRCDWMDDGCADGPGSRLSLFGFSWTTYGENIAANQATSWQAVEAWVTECPPPIDPTEGHRLNILNGNFNVIGVGSYLASGGCWARFYASDYSRVSGLQTPRLPSAVHRPESGSSLTSFTFYANWYEPGAKDPLSIDVVIDGVCRPMSVELGGAGNRTFAHQTTLPDGCREYYIVARDSGGARVTYPEAGALLVEIGGGPCAGDYQDTRMPADCEAAVDAGVPDGGGADGGGADGGGADGGGADGGGAIDSGPGLDAAPDDGGAVDSGPGLDAASDGGLPPDAGGDDGGGGTDMGGSADAALDSGVIEDGSPALDEGVEEDADPGPDPDLGAGGDTSTDGTDPDSEISAGCSCEMGRGTGSTATWPWLAIALVFGWRRRTPRR